MTSQRTKRIVGVIIDVELLILGALSVLFFAGIWSRLASEEGPELVAPENRRIAAVYIAARLHRLEAASPYAPSAPGDPLRAIAEYFATGKDLGVKKSIVPVLSDYEIESDFLAGRRKAEGSAIVIAARAARTAGKGRLVVQADGDIKAVEVEGAVLGRDIAEIAGVVHEVTPH